MRNDLTDITLVVDRSGSMREIQSDAEGGVNAFIEKQAAEPGEALLTLCSSTPSTSSFTKACRLDRFQNMNLHHEA